eukprot:scaffold129816_cov18-Tisochrysis_lutea.AAC.1
MYYISTELANPIPEQLSQAAHRNCELLQQECSRSRVDRSCPARSCISSRAITSGSGIGECKCPYTILGKEAAISCVNAAPSPPLLAWEIARRHNPICFLVVVHDLPFSLVSYSYAQVIGSPLTTWLMVYNEVRFLRAQHPFQPILLFMDSITPAIRDPGWGIHGAAVQHYEKLSATACLLYARVQDMASELNSVVQPISLDAVK